MGRSALIVVDVQKAFDEPAWGARNNPDCERNIGALIDTWRERGFPVVFVRHDGLEEESPHDTLGREHPGNAFKELLEGGRPARNQTRELRVPWKPGPGGLAGANGVDAITVCGIQTQMCCETTARVGGNLGFEMTFAIDATHTFDLPAYGGGTLCSDEVARVTASNLDPEFGRVATTAELTG